MVHEIEFTAASLFRIATLEARRGRNDPGCMFPSVAAKISELKTIHSERRRACSPLWSTDERRARETYASFGPTIATLREEKKNALYEELLGLSAKLSTSIREDQFAWGLQPGPMIRERPTYRVRPDVDSYFAMKQLESNLKRSLRIEAPDRHRLVNQLVDALEGKLPRYVLKTDISSYYESIPHSLLIDLLETATGLSRTSRDLIRALLDEWAAMTGLRVGLPRGVGLSSYLAEAYARLIDDAVAADPRVHFYGRYVDDIVFIARSDVDREEIASELRKKLSELGLKPSVPKTLKVGPAHFEGTTKRNPYDLDGAIEFLGYSVSKKAGTGEVAVDISPRTLARYEERLSRSFDRWASTARRSEGHDGLLFDRVRFLTGNTKLANSKGRAVTGIYFNHTALSAHAPGLVKLDGVLSSLVNKYESNMSDVLRERLLRASFTQGFISRRFHNYSQAQLVRIVAVWRDS